MKSILRIVELSTLGSVASAVSSTCAGLARTSEEVARVASKSAAKMRYHEQVTGMYAKGYKTLAKQAQVAREQRLLAVETAQLRFIQARREALQREEEEMPKMRNVTPNRNIPGLPPREDFDDRFAGNPAFEGA